MHSPNLCVVCKGTKHLCGLSSCPLLRKMNIQTDLKERIGESVFGPANEIFVGSYGYPNLSVGPLVSSLERPLSPNELYGMKYERIIEERVKLLRGKRISKVGKRIEERMGEVALSERSIDVEMSFTRKPNFDMKFSSITEPMGASAPLKDYKITENPKIPEKVDSILEDNLLAVEAIDELNYYGFDNYYLSRIMSVGALGKKDSRKIVPTRWSITAIDDTIGKKLMERVREYPQLNEILVFHNEFLHNHFEILLIPGAWEFENFEAWSPKSIWAQEAKEPVISEEYEGFFGRTTYADKQTGGYYASRIGILEYLSRIRRQARVVVIREIGEGYIVPVGVWEVRENVRHAFFRKGGKFTNINEALEDVSSRLRTPINTYRKLSKVLSQSRLNQFF